MRAASLCAALRVRPGKVVHAVWGEKSAGDPDRCGRETMGRAASLDATDCPGRQEGRRRVRVARMSHLSQMPHDSESAAALQRGARPRLPGFRAGEPGRCGGIGRCGHRRRPKAGRLALPDLSRARAGRRPGGVPLAGSTGGIRRDCFRRAGCDHAPGPASHAGVGLVPGSPVSVRQRADISPFSRLRVWNERSFPLIFLSSTGRQRPADSNHNRARQQRRDPPGH